MSALIFFSIRFYHESNSSLFKPAGIVASLNITWTTNLVVYLCFLIWVLCHDFVICTPSSLLLSSSESCQEGPKLNCKFFGLTSSGEKELSSSVSSLTGTIICSLSRILSFKESLTKLPLLNLFLNKLCKSLKDVFIHFDLFFTNDIKFILVNFFNIN